MTTTSDITKTKLAVLAAEMMRFSRENHLDLTAFLGQTLLKYRESHEIADSVYDLFQLLAALSETKRPNRVFQELVGRTKRTRKNCSPSSYARLYVEFSMKQDLPSWETANGFSRLLVFLFEVIYDGVYAGSSFVAPQFKIEIHAKSILESGVLNCSLFYIATAGFSDLPPYMSEEDLRVAGSAFQQWFESNITAPSETSDPGFNPPKNSERIEDVTIDF